MSNVMALRFGEEGGIIMADSIATFSSGNILYRNSKLFHLGNSVVGRTGNVADTGYAIDVCRERYADRGVRFLAQKIKELSDEGKKRKFTEMYLKPRSLSFEDMGDELYEVYTKGEFFEANFLSIGFHGKSVEIHVTVEEQGSPSFLSSKGGNFISLGMGADVAVNNLCNYINKNGQPSSKGESYRLLLETFGKINIQESVSRPYDAYVLEDGNARRIPMELNELNAKLLELAEAGVIDFGVLEESMDRTVNYESLGSVMAYVMKETRQNQPEMLKYLLRTPRV